MSETNDPALDHAMNSLRRWQHAKRMENALREVLKYYDEAGEAGKNYELAPDNLAKFAADLCKEYEKSDLMAAYKFRPSSLSSLTL